MSPFHTDTRGKLGKRNVDQLAVVQQRSNALNRVTILIDRVVGREGKDRHKGPRSSRKEALRTYLGG